jgi:hypothetical protein
LGRSHTGLSSIAENQNIRLVHFGIVCSFLRHWRKAGKVVGQAD